METNTVETETAHFILSQEVKTVTLQTPTGFLTLVQAEGGVALKVEGDLTLAATGTVRIEGAQIALDAANLVDIKGGIVKIN